LQLGKWFFYRLFLAATDVYVVVRMVSLMDKIKRVAALVLAFLAGWVFYAFASGDAFFVWLVVRLYCQCG
jgi:hypothetical protein